MYLSYQQLPAPIATLTAGSETAVISTPPTNPPPGPLVVRALLNLTGGATGGVWTLRVRRGVGVAGAVVGAVQSITFAATTTQDVGLEVYDATPPLGGNGVYTVTANATGSNGSANDGGLEVLNPTPFGQDE